MLRVRTKRLVLLVIVLFQITSMVAADEQQIERKQVEKVLKQAEKLKATMQLSENAHQQKGQEAAQQTAKEYASPGFQEKLRCQMEMIQPNGPPQKQARVEQKNSSLTAQESVYLFLSSSMPESAVNRYLIDINRIGEQRIMPVLFGLPQGLEGKRLNADYFNRVMLADPQCRDKPKSPCRRLEMPIKVNPELFTRYNITEVPILVYDNGQNSWSIQGETELAYLLEKINKAANSPVLSGIPTRLRGAQ
jgi:hypothetical protein